MKALSKLIGKRDKFAHLYTAGDHSTRSDDFDWTTYNESYAKQLAKMERDHTLKLAPGDAILAHNALVLRAGLKPLHENHAALYTAIATLAPKTAIEIGCGGGDHLHNLGLLTPAIDIRGFDRSDGQLSYLRQRSPHLADKVGVLDITMPPSRNLPTADLVYTQAVLMHIQAGNGHLVALANMTRIARDTMVLMENWRRHPFQDDIRRLHELGCLAWDEVHFHVWRLAGRPKAMVVSRTALPLEPLGAYADLVGAMPA